MTIFFPHWCWRVSRFGCNDVRTYVELDGCSTRHCQVCRLCPSRLRMCLPLECLCLDALSLSCLILSYLFSALMHVLYLLSFLLSLPFSLFLFIAFSFLNLSSHSHSIVDSFLTPVSPFSLLSLLSSLSSLFSNLLFSLTSCVNLFFSLFSLLPLSVFPFFAPLSFHSFPPCLSVSPHAIVFLLSCLFVLLLTVISSSSLSTDGLTSLSPPSPLSFMCSPYIDVLVFLGVLAFSQAGSAVIALA